MARVIPNSLIYCTKERTKNLINDLNASEFEPLIREINCMPPHLRAAVIRTLMTAVRDSQLTNIPPLTKL